MGREWGGTAEAAGVPAPDMQVQPDAALGGLKRGLDSLPGATQEKQLKVSPAGAAGTEPWTKIQAPTSGHTKPPPTRSQELLSGNLKYHQEGHLRMSLKTCSGPGARRERLDRGG